MKYTTEEALAEIMRRGEQVARRRERRERRALSGAAGLLLTALVAAIAALPGGAAAAATGTVYGAFLLPSEAGGYVLAALLAFAAGVVITLYLIRRQRWKDTRDDTEEREP